MKIFVWVIGQEMRRIIEGGMLPLDAVEAFIDGYSHAESLCKSMYIEINVRK